MTDGATEVLLAEFNALRNEVLGIRQIQTAVFTAALTILAAVGSFALAKKNGRIEVLLVLPYVLSGLGVIELQCAVGVANVGKYIREELWSRMPTDRSAKTPSWEHFIDRTRGNTIAYRLSTLATPALILWVPSVASLAITHRQAVTALWPLWWGGFLATVLFPGIAMALARHSNDGCNHDLSTAGSMAD